ncbi:MAG: phosphotransferase, partial [Ottowia sp.]|nr:phosphotransferase [Ottowia sp.]
MLEGMNFENPAANTPRYEQALGALLRWQQASCAGELPPYDTALLRRELGLFDEWYVAQHRRYVLADGQRQELYALYDRIIQHCLAAPQVFVHRDYMPRNLMLPDDGAPELGVLDFQDAVYGPITYDIASLMRDAFHSWEPDFVLDITRRYWERARAAGLLDFEGWSQDFQAFWRAVQWMALQRHLKVAGIFARLTLRDGKPKYLADAPRFIAYIRHTAAQLPELAPLLRLLDALGV